MGYYCGWGDARMMYSSEEEGYENRAVYRRQGKVRTPLFEYLWKNSPPISDDADRQFWAEDELSNSESRQRLTARRKHRHSHSYRNRITNRSRSRVPCSSNSSSDSARAATLSKIGRGRRRYWSKPKAEKLQSINAREISYANTYSNGTSCSIKNEPISSESQSTSSMNHRSKSSRSENPAISCNHHRERVNDATRSFQKMWTRGANSPSKSKQK